MSTKKPWIANQLTKKSKDERPPWTSTRSAKPNKACKLLQHLLFAAIAAWGLYLTQGVMGDAPLRAQAEPMSTAMLALR